MKIVPQELLKANQTQEMQKAADKKLVKSIQDFEAIFVGYMLKAMRETIPKSEFMEEAPGKDIYISLFDQEIAKSIASRGNDTMVEAMYRQLTGESMPSQLRSTGIVNSTANVRAYAGKNTREQVEFYSPIIQEAAEAFGIDPNLVKAVISQESSGKSAAISSKGASGLMQLMPETAAEMGVSNIFNPKENIFGGTRYLKKMLDEFDGDVSLALAAYNAGPAAVKKYGGIPPYDETKNYVKRVKRFYEAFQKE